MTAMEVKPAGPLNPSLLREFADGFSRMEMPLDLLAEALSVLYMFHDPAGKYSLAAKVGELSLRFSLDAREDPKAPVELYTAFYNSMIALLEDIEKETKSERAVNRLSDLSEALLALHAGPESADNVCNSWLIAVLKGMVARFNIPVKSPAAMQEYTEKTFEPSMASIFNYSVSLSGKLSKGEVDRNDLVLVISMLIILTSKVNAIRKKAIDLMQKGMIPETGRNDPCPCGSGKKYKNCCMLQ